MLLMEHGNWPAIYSLDFCASGQPFIGPVRSAPDTAQLNPTVFLPFKSLHCGWGRGHSTQMNSTLQAILVILSLLDFSIGLVKDALSDHWTWLRWRSENPMLAWSGAVASQLATGPIRPAMGFEDLLSSWIQAVILWKYSRLASESLKWIQYRYMWFRKKSTLWYSLTISC